MNVHHDIGIASQIGKYGDAVEIPANSRWLVTSGTPGLELNGSVPNRIVAQSEMAWRHIIAMLEQAGMTIGDIVKITQYLTSDKDIAAYAKVRSEFLGDLRPASMLMVVPALVRPEFLVEVEIMAAKKLA